MVRRCCICNVQATIYSDISLHRLPNDEATKQKWLLNIGRKTPKYGAVCNQHFKDDDFVYKVCGENVRRFLKAGAVPRLSYTEIDSENVGHQKNKDTKSCSEESIVSPLRNSNNVRLSIPINSEVPFNGQECSPQGDHNFECSTPLNAEISAVESDSNQNFTNLTSPTNLMDIDNNRCSQKNENTDSDQTDISIEGSTLKRKMNEPHAAASGKRFCNARFVGNLRRKDFTSDRSWNLFKNHIDNTKKKQKVLTQKVRRLKLKIENVQSLLKHLKENGLLSNEACNALDVS